MLLSVFKRQPLFFLCLFAVTVPGLLCLILYPSADVFIQLNFFHNNYLNTFFDNFTLLGDGIFTIAVFLVLILMDRLTLAAQILGAYLMSGIAVQVLKVVVAAPRPREIIPAGTYHNFIDGITHYGFSSFPSGHTASAFALATLFCLHAHTKQSGPVFAMLAIAVGYSRIYLGQHFLTDVMAGAFIGMLSAIVMYRYLQEVKFGRVETPVRQMQVSFDQLQKSIS